MGPIDRFIAVGRLGLRSQAYARHVYQKLAALTFGVVFVSATGQRLRRSIARFRRHVPPPQLKTAVVAHLFYLDLFPENLRCWEQLPNGSILHLTVPNDRVEEAQRLVQGIADVVVHAGENRGRDIGPFIVLLDAGTFDIYDAVLKLHSKRSPHLLDGEIRRKLLFSMLAGESNAIRRLLAAFEEPDTGIVGWKDCYHKASPYWMGNRARVTSLGAEMGIPVEDVRLGFFEGSMFWFRPAALERLRGLKLSWDDFEAEARQLDGTLHHAIERCFTLAARARTVTAFAT